MAIFPLKYPSKAKDGRRFVTFHKLSNYIYAPCYPLWFSHFFHQTNTEETVTNGFHRIRAVQLTRVLAVYLLQVTPLLTPDCAVPAPARPAAVYQFAQQGRGKLGSAEEAAPDDRCPGWVLRGGYGLGTGEGEGGGGGG